MMMPIEVKNGTMEFECHRERTDDGLPKTFESGNFKLYDDGAGYVDIECLDECPYCGGNHWK
jgi:hypothetical protein